MVYKSLKDGQSHILLKFKESKEPIQFKLSYVMTSFQPKKSVSINLVLEELYRSQF